MSGLTFVNETAERSLQNEKIEPSKVWKNWGRIKIEINSTCQDCRRTRNLKVGEVHSSCCRTWPTKDLAETYAERFKTPAIEFVGAYPVGERP